MKPRYIIHAGPMKTASTYLQQGFTAVQPYLQAQGVYYPPELIDPGNKHMHMPVYEAIVRRQGERLRPVFRKINEDGHRTVFLSCEHLSFLRPEEWRTLRDVTEANDFTIVHVVRRWSDRIASLWNQGLFMGGYDTLPEFYLALLNGKPPEYYPKNLGGKAGFYDIDYSLLWQEQAGVFGREAIQLLPYDAQTQGADIFVRFCTDVLGIENPQAPKFLGDKRWASMPRTEAELLRALNALYVKAEGRTTVDIRNMMLWNRVTFDRGRFDAAMAGETAELIIDDASVYFDRAYARMAEWLDRVAGPDTSRAGIFERVARPNAYVRQGWLAEPGMADALRALYADVLSARGVSA